MAAIRHHQEGKVSMTEVRQDNRIAIARHHLATSYVQPYHRTAILSGQWDTGSLFRAALAEVDRKAATTTTEAESPDG